MQTTPLVVRVTGCRRVRCRICPSGLCLVTGYGLRHQYLVARYIGRASSPPPRAVPATARQGACVDHAPRRTAPPAAPFSPLDTLAHASISRPLHVFSALTPPSSRQEERLATHATIKGSQHYPEAAPLRLSHAIERARSAAGLTNPHRKPGPEPETTALT